MTWLLIKKNTPYAHRILVVHFEERGQVYGYDVMAMDEKLMDVITHFLDT